MEHAHAESSKHPRCAACPGRFLGSMGEADERLLALLERSRVSRQTPRGQPLHREGTPARGVHCIRSGLVKISRTAGRGRPCLLRIQGPGDLLGLEDVFARARHSTTAEALEVTVACFVESAVLHEIFETQPAVANAIARELAFTARASEVERSELASCDVRERVARLLLRLVRRFGRPGSGGQLLGVPLTREEIAEMVGVAHETAIRQLSAFREEKILGDAGRAIVVLDETRLVRAAGVASRP